MMRSGVRQCSVLFGSVPGRANGNVSTSDLRGEKILGRVSADIPLSAGDRAFGVVNFDQFWSVLDWVGAEQADGQFFGEKFSGGLNPWSTQCFTGDHSIWVDSFARFRDGFAGLRQRLCDLNGGRSVCGAASVPASMHEG